MFIRKKRNASGSISVQIIEKIGRNNKVVQTIGSSKDEIEIELLYEEGLKLIPQLTKQPILNLFPFLILLFFIIHCINVDYKHNTQNSSTDKLYQIIGEMYQK